MDLSPGARRVPVRAAGTLVRLLAGALLIGGLVTSAAGAWAQEPVEPVDGAASATTGDGDWRRLTDPRERFALANRYYEEGHFSEAAAVYDSILEAGLQSPALYLNLGNALLRAGELGEAIVAYRRGLVQSPRDQDLQANLSFAESLSIDVVPEESTSVFLEWLAGLVRRVSAREALLIATVLYWLSAAVFLLGRLAPRWRRGAGLVMWGLLPAFGLSAVLAAERAHAVWASRDAIVLAEAVQVRTGPGEDYSARFNLHEGTTVTVRRTADGWLEIELTDELSGWVPAATLARIGPTG